jgi:hypothetical protein
LSAALPMPPIAPLHHPGDIVADHAYRSVHRFATLVEVATK